jgi:hypothetical protein
MCYKLTMQRCTVFVLSVVMMLLACPPNLFAQWREFNSVTGITENANSLTLTLQHGSLRLQVCSDAVIRLTLFPPERIQERPDYVLLKQDCAPAPWNHRETDAEITLSTAKLRVVVNRRTGAIDYVAGERPLLRDENRWLTAATVNGE